MSKVHDLLKGRGGFTLLELVIVMTALGTVFMIAMPQVNESRRVMDLNRAVRTVALDLELALSVAARQRSAVEILQPAGTRSMVVRDAQDGTEYLRRNFGDGSSARLDDLVLTPALVVVSPTGLATSALTVAVEIDTSTRLITMSQAGQVRVAP
jgi:prepilin-type N-terminal cleavage/methylation domain-containing protein